MSSQGQTNHHSDPQSIPAQAVFTKRAQRGEWHAGASRVFNGIAAMGCLFVMGWGITSNHPSAALAGGSQAFIHALTATAAARRQQKFGDIQANPAEALENARNAIRNSGQPNSCGLKTECLDKIAIGRVAQGIHAGHAADYLALATGTLLFGTAAQTHPLAANALWVGTMMLGYGYGVNGARSLQSAFRLGDEAMKDAHLHQSPANPPARPSPQTHQPLSPHA